MDQASVISKTRGDCDARACGGCVWRWLALWTAITVIAILISGTWFDVSVSTWARTAGLGPLRPSFETISEFGRAVWYLLVFGALMPLAWLVGARWIARRATLLFVAVLVSGLVVQGLKLIIGRHRPKAFFDDGMYGLAWLSGGYDTASFPSGHTSTIAAIAASLWICVPRWRDIWVIPVVLVGISRVLNGAHYPSDVVGGAYVGAVSTFLVYRSLRWAGLGDLAPGKSRPMISSVSHLPLE